MMETSGTDTIVEYLDRFCRDIQQLHNNVRFVGIADYAGKLVASAYRLELVPLMDKLETEQYALQTVFRARTRGGFKPQLGNQRYATAVYENLVRSTITVNHPEHEHHNMYFLLSLDVGCDYPNIIEKSILPFLSENTSALFEMTRMISEKYAD
jgi:hypothetical protein